MSTRGKGLNEQQRIFCNEYLIDFDGQRSAIAANYSEKTAKVIASQLLTRPHIQEHIKKLNDKRLKKTKIDAETVLKELHMLATTDVGECFNEDGSLKAIKDMSPMVRKAISSFKVRVEKGDEFAETTEVKLWSKDKSLENLGKHLKLFTDKIEHSGKVTLEDLVSKSNEGEE